MSLTDEKGGFYMPVAPAYSGGNFGNGFGGDSWWGILLLIALLNGGFGFGGFGGGAMWPMMGAGMADGFGLYPWLNNSQNINGGFRDQMLNDTINNIGDKVASGFGDVQLGIAGVNQNICQTGNGIVSAITGGFSAAEASENARQMANMQQMFALQSALQTCCCENRAATADLKYTVATEACADRAAVGDALRDVITAGTANTQKILDKLCALELDGVKGQLAQAQRENVGLQNQLNIAAMQVGMNNEVDALYNRLKNCPVPTMPVYGNTPIFTCGGNTGCGCGA